MAKYQSQGGVGKACPICGGRFAFLLPCGWHISGSNCVTSFAQVSVTRSRIVPSLRIHKGDKSQVILEKELEATSLSCSGRRYTMLFYGACISRPSAWTVSVASMSRFFVFDAALRKYSNSRGPSALHNVWKADVTSFSNSRGGPERGSDSTIMDRQRSLHIPLSAILPSSRTITRSLNAKRIEDRSKS